MDMRVKAEDIDSVKGRGDREEENKSETEKS
jgi:hypothetical protein